MIAFAEHKAPKVEPQEVFQAIANLAKLGKLGAGNHEYMEMALLAHAADEKARLTGREGVFESIKGNVLKPYGNRAGFGELIHDALGANPKPKTVSTMTVFAKKIKTFIGTHGLDEAFQQAEVEFIALKSMPKE